LVKLIVDFVNFALFQKVKLTRSIRPRTDANSRVKKKKEKKVSEINDLRKEKKKKKRGARRIKRWHYLELWLKTNSFCLT
jgi:hypothetical protein